MPAMIYFPATDVPLPLPICAWIPSVPSRRARRAPCGTALCQRGAHHPIYQDVLEFPLTEF